MSEVYTLLTVTQEQSCIDRRLWNGEAVKRASRDLASSAITLQRWLVWGNGTRMPLESIWAGIRDEREGNRGDSKKCREPLKSIASPRASAVLHLACSPHVDHSASAPYCLPHCMPLTLSLLPSHSCYLATHFHPSSPTTHAAFSRLVPAPLTLSSLPSHMLLIVTRCTMWSLVSRSRCSTNIFTGVALI